MTDHRDVTRLDDGWVMIRYGAQEWELHRDGVEWRSAPLPGRLHRCTTWSVYQYRRGSAGRWKFCACGAQWVPNAFVPGWANKNQRRRKGTVSSPSTSY